MPMQDPFSQLSCYQETLAGMLTMHRDRLFSRQQLHSLAMIATHIAISQVYWVTDVTLGHEPSVEEEERAFAGILGISGKDDGFSRDTGVIDSWQTTDFIRILTASSAAVRGAFTGAASVSHAHVLVHVVSHTAYHVGEAKGVSQHLQTHL